MARPEVPRSERSQKVAELRAKQAAAQRKKVIAIGGVGVLAVAAVVLGVVLTHKSDDKSAAPSPTSSASPGPTPGALGPEGIPLEGSDPLASVNGAADGATVDGIQCNSSEQVAYHIHAHLAVYLNGAPRAIPAGIGVNKPQLTQTPQGPFAGATNCYYWLHTHATDGVIHIESPTETTYTLGQFFDIWRQPLTANQVGPNQGLITVFVNGTHYTGDPRAIALHPHDVIQLDIGDPTPPVAVNWSTSQL